MPMQLLGGLLAGVALVGGTNGARAIDLEDERSNSRMKGYDLIYEARELELPQSVRDGLQQVCQRVSVHILHKHVYHPPRQPHILH